MKTKLTLVLLALAAVASTGFSGCDDYVTPSGVVRTAARAVHDNDIGALKKALSGDALARFGSEEGVKAIRGMLAGMNGLRIEDAKLIGSKPINNNGFQTAIRTYSVAIVGKNGKGAAESRALSAVVNCDIYEIGTGSCKFNGPTTGPGNCGSWGEDTSEVTECKIAEIR